MEEEAAIINEREEIAKIQKAKGREKKAWRNLMRYHEGKDVVAYAAAYSGYCGAQMEHSRMTDRLIAIWPEKANAIVFGGPETRGGDR